MPLRTRDELRWHKAASGDWYCETAGSTYIARKFFLIWKLFLQDAVGDEVELAPQETLKSCKIAAGRHYMKTRE